jgi:hypothetical protein
VCVGGGGGGSAILRYFMGRLLLMKPFWSYFAYSIKQPDLLDLSDTDLVWAYQH